MGTIHVRCYEFVMFVNIGLCDSVLYNVKVARKL
jgi:hypothetical protein